LERRLGVSLFDRTRSGAQLTPAGEQFFQEATFGAEQLTQAVTAMKQVHRGSTGLLRIGVMTSMAGGFLSDLLYRFRARFPEVRVAVEEGSSQSNAASVLSGRLDVAFLPGAPQLPSCRVRQLWKEQVYLALPKDHPLAERVHIAWADVKDEAFLVHADGAGPEVEAYLIRKLSGLGFRPRITAQKVGRENLLNMVGQGFGLTVTTFASLATTYAGVKFVSVGEKPEFITSSAVWPLANSNPVLKQFLELSERLAFKYEMMPQV
jgi:DNA-binding transcriptional LysR family regulator